MRLADLHRLEGEHVVERNKAVSGELEGIALVRNDGAAINGPVDVKQGDFAGAPRACAARTALRLVRHAGEFDRQRKAGAQLGKLESVRLPGYQAGRTEAGTRWLAMTQVTCCKIRSAAGAAIDQVSDQAQPSIGRVDLRQDLHALARASCSAAVRDLGILDLLEDDQLRWHAGQRQQPGAHLLGLACSDHVRPDAVPRAARGACHGSRR